MYTFCVTYTATVRGFYGTLPSNTRELASVFETIMVFRRKRADNVSSWTLTFYHCRPLNLLWSWTRFWESDLRKLVPSPTWVSTDRTSSTPNYLSKTKREGLKLRVKGSAFAQRKIKPSCPNTMYLFQKKFPPSKLRIYIQILLTPLLAKYAHVN